MTYCGPENRSPPWVPGDRPRTPIKLEMGLASEEGYPHPGRADYTDPGVDPGTGTIRTRGVFENAGGVILPGLFVRVRAAIETAHRRPARAQRGARVRSGG